MCYGIQRELFKCTAGVCSALTEFKVSNSEVVKSTYNSLNLKARDKQNV